MRLYSLLIAVALMGSAGCTHSSASQPPPTGPPAPTPASSAPPSLTEQESRALMEAALADAFDQPEEQVLKAVDASLARGARPSLEDLRRVAMVGYTRVAQRLLEAGAPMQDKAVLSAILGGNPEMLRLMLEKGGNAKARINGVPLIVHAAEARNLEMVRLLLDHGADPNAADEREMGNGLRALSKASQQNDVAMAELLLSRGADLQAKTPSGLSMLALAAGAGAVNTLEFFASKGLDVNERDKHGYRTPLMLAVIYDAAPAARRLIELGADPDLKDASGVTARERARTPWMRAVFEEAAKKRAQPGPGHP